MGVGVGSGVASWVGSGPGFSDCAGVSVAGFSVCAGMGSADGVGVGSGVCSPVLMFSPDSWVMTRVTPGSPSDNASLISLLAMTMLSLFMNVSL